VCVSEEDASRLVERYGAHRSRTEVVLNGVDCGAIRPASREERITRKRNWGSKGSQWWYFPGRATRPTSMQRTGFWLGQDRGKGLTCSILSWGSGACIASRKNRSNPDHWTRSRCEALLPGSGSGDQPDDLGQRVEPEAARVPGGGTAEYHHADGSSRAGAYALRACVG